MHVKTLSPAARKIDHEEYSTFLRRHGLKYKEADSSYYQVGNIKGTQGWILHISVIKSQIPNLLHALIPILAKEKVACKVVRNIRCAIQVLEGELGYDQLGKIIKIYTENDGKAAELTEIFTALTKDFRGPEIPGNAHLGGTVYASYERFDSIYQIHPNRENHRRLRSVSVKRIPFQFPKDVRWPFQDHLIPQKKFLNVFNNTYLIIRELKSDIKGRVMKAFRVKGFKITFCVLKEGNHDTSIDQFGRDNQERLRWQYKLQKELNQKIPLPKIDSLFEENGNVYLAMEYIGGPTLDKKIANIFKKTNAWSQLEVRSKVKLLKYLVMVIEIIENLHVTGYIHRDISPVNFIITRNNRIVMIDLESTYSVNENRPTPPFSLGTEGFRAPEQKFFKKPSTSEDIYSLGALMFLFFTNKNPADFQRVKIGKALVELTEDNSLSKLIATCLENDPVKRPTLNTVKRMIQNYHKEMSDKV